VSGLLIETAAKVNLCLRVLGRRADGYHEVETVLHSVGVWDRLRLDDTDSSAITVTVAAGEVPPLDSARGGFSLAGGDPELAEGPPVESARSGARPSEVQIPEGEANLCWQAAALLAERAGVKRGAAIVLEKGIPARSGLGGGSSDAAATLLGLVRLWDLHLRPEELEAVAAEVGADVPFFLRGGCCLARGMGERLTPCPELSAWLVLVAPERGVPTGQAYAALRRGATLGRRRAQSRPIKRLLEALKTGEITSVAAALHNDFEAAKIAGVEEALRAKAELLAAGCLGAGMSGSGSAVFGIARDLPHAEEVVAQLRPNWPWVAAAPTLGAGHHLTITGAVENHA
jgi:4-diphosphocytidyl-2-C-methyl-D-erythritol kinase